MTETMIKELHERFMEYYKKDFPPLLGLADNIGIGAFTLKEFMWGSVKPRVETYYRIEKFLDNVT